MIRDPNVSEETLQLQIDVINVYEKRVDIASFPPERQKQIKDYYRFSPVSPASLAASAAQRMEQRQSK
jgi:hypothetical protein